MSLAVLASITKDMVRELAVNAGVCVRPLVRRVLDRDTGTDSRVTLACGSTREAVCPPCARKARVLRMQQCSEGWHRDSEPARPDPDEVLDQDQDDDETDEEEGLGSRRVRSTRRRADAPDLPRVPMDPRTVGRTFVSRQGREYRPSMFLTLTLPSYGAVSGGVPVNPGTYDYRRAALDALHFPKLVDRFVQNLRRCAGYRVQYFAAIEPQARLAPHLHMAIRGTIPRALIKQVIKATYLQLWWPQFDQPVYVHRQPVWAGGGYCDPDTGLMLPTWAEALDGAKGGEPVHVMRLGSQFDAAGIDSNTDDADRAVRYLVKYLTKAVADPLGDHDGSHPARERHIDRLHDELRFLPCSPRCANWLRYGVQPDQPGPGLIPGRCASKAHDREHLGIGGRRVLVSRDWSGKTLKEHKADRATVVREALESAGMLPPEVERMAADILSPDGLPRFIWTDEQPDGVTYTLSLLRAVAERQKWRAQYRAAKDAAGAVDNRSATGTDPPHSGAARSSASPDNPPDRAAGTVVTGERSESRSDTSAASALDGRTEGPTLPNRGRPSPRPPTNRTDQEEDNHERSQD